MGPLLDICILTLVLLTAAAAWNGMRRR